MSKKFVGFAAAVAFSAALIMPFSASASALTSAQIDAIVSLLQSFGADSTTIANVRTSLGGSTTPPTSCVDLYSNTTLGSSGAEVTKLQNYLIDKDYLEAQYNTGYYGFITAKAVGKLQFDLNLVSSASDPAFGIMGPKTRAAIACTNPIPTRLPLPLPPEPTPGPLHADLKINGSDGPVILADEDPITLSWISTGSNSCYITNIRTTYGGSNATKENLPPSGSIVAYAALFGTNNSIALQCGQASDSVQLILKQSTLPTATITSPSTQSSGNVSVSGMFSNTSASSAIVALISQPYTGATDWNTVGGYLQGGVFATTPNGNKLYSYSTAVTGPDHQFSTAFPGIPSGSYVVLIYTGTYYSQTFLTQATLTVTAGTPSATIDKSSLTASTGGKDTAAVTLTGSASNTNRVAIVIKGQTTVTVYASVVGGRWWGTVANVYPNTYTVQILNEDTGGSKEETLATGTLTVTAPPTCSVSVSGGTITWKSANATSATSDLDYWPTQAYGSVPVNGSRTVSPTTNTNYSFWFTGPGGNVTCVTPIITPQSTLPVCPADATARRGQNSSTYACMCPANASAKGVWGGAGGSYGGANYYTDISDICTAGAQAGQMNLTSGGEVDYTISAGQNYYYGTTQNGITSQSWGSWPGSFSITGPKG